MTKLDLKVEFAKTLAHHGNFLVDIVDMGALSCFPTMIDSNWVFTHNEYGDSTLQRFTYSLVNRVSEERLVDIFLSRKVLNVHGSSIFEVFEVKCNYYKRGGSVETLEVSSTSHLGYEEILKTVVDKLPLSVIKRYSIGFNKAGL